MTRAMRAELKETEDAIYTGWPGRAFLHAVNLARLGFQVHPELREGGVMPHNWILTVCNSRGLVAWDMHLGAITAKQAEKIRRNYERIGTAGLIYKVERTTIPMQPFGGWTSKITATMV